MAAKLQLAQLDMLVYNITSWHQPLNDSDIMFEHRTQPFVHEVQCLAAGIKNCPENDNELDEWDFVV
ncbi:hypothetical protein V5799_027610 [Amblyomma americanum]|uniref:Uncharacterized protein n=1 Tax=Amblyomma americanum TaxID=6943 RepID=A0AAQ4DF84_AMBAM